VTAHEVGEMIRWVAAIVAIVGVMIAGNRWAGK
jgi:hypothetical protein